MMPTKTKIDGRDMVVGDEKFRTVTEDWNEYETVSGVIVRVKTVVHKIGRIRDQNGKPVFTAEGDPHMAVRSQIQVVTSGGQPRDEEVH